MRCHSERHSDLSCTLAKSAQVFSQIDEDKDHVPAQVEWPDDVEKIDGCLNLSNIGFKDVRDYGSCDCLSGCFMDTCANVGSAVNCTKKTYNLDVRRSNAPVVRSTLTPIAWDSLLFRILVWMRAML